MARKPFNQGTGMYSGNFAGLVVEKLGKNVTAGTNPFYRDGVKAGGWAQQRGVLLFPPFDSDAFTIVDDGTLSPPSSISGNFGTALNTTGRPVTYDARIFHDDDPFAFGAIYSQTVFSNEPGFDREVEYAYLQLGHQQPVFFDLYRLYFSTQTGNFRLDIREYGLESYHQVPDININLPYLVTATDGIQAVSQVLYLNITNPNGHPPFIQITSVNTEAFYDSENDLHEIVGSIDVVHRDPNAEVTFEINGGAYYPDTESNVPGYDRESVAPNYGTLLSNTSTGDFKFIPAESAEHSGQTIQFSVTASASSYNTAYGISVMIEESTEQEFALGTLSAVHIVDTIADDTFLVSNGTVFPVNVRPHSQIQYSIEHEVDDYSVDGFTRRQDGTYGHLLLNDQTGDYRYVPNNNLINSLSLNASESFNISARMTWYDSEQQEDTASTTLTVSISAANDGPSTIDTTALANAGGTQNTGATGLRVGVVTDPEGDVVTDISSGLNSLPAWLSFSNQVLGNGTVEYFWEVGANEIPWRNGSASLQLQASSSGIHTPATSISITFACQSDYCNDYLRSTDTVTSPAVYDATNINAIRTGLKIGSDDFLLLTTSERDALFDTGTAATGTFRQIYTSAETGSDSPVGTWTLDQHLSVNYQTRELTLTSSISASNITYFDGASDDFSYVSTMDYSDIQAGTTAVFEKQTNSSQASGYNIMNGSSASVNVNFLDQVGFVLDSDNQVRALVINTAITPDSNNPLGYKDDTREMIQREWRVGEPQ